MSFSSHLYKGKKMSDTDRQKYPELNKVMVIGRLVRDCEVKYLESGNAIIDFTVALDGSAQRGKEAAFIDFAKFGEEVKVAEYLKKGTKIFVEGRISQTRTEVEGKKRTFTNFVCDRLQLLDSAKSQDSESSPLPSLDDMPMDDFDPFPLDAPAAAPKTTANSGDKLFTMLEDHYGDSSEWGNKQVISLINWVLHQTDTEAPAQTLKGLKAQLSAISSNRAITLEMAIKKAFSQDG
jgi:single-strand DNA-binding protein